MMSDFYTFVTDIIFHNPEKADRIEEELKKNLTAVTRLQTEHGNVYFAGYIRNLGGGPHELSGLFDVDIKVIVVGEDNQLYFHAGPSKPIDLTEAMENAKVEAE